MNYYPLTGYNISILATSYQLISFSLSSDDLDPDIYAEVAHFR